MKRHYFSPEVAARYGVPQAVILDNLSYFINQNMEKGKLHIDGEYWCAKTLQGFEKQMPYFTISKIRRLIDNLKKGKIIEIKKLGKHASDQTNYYCIKCPFVKKIYLSKSANDRVPELANDHVSESANGYYLSSSLKSLSNSEKKEILNTSENRFSEKSKKNSGRLLCGSGILICEVEAEVVKSEITASIKMTCEVLGIQQPEPGANAVIVELIMKKFRYFRFCDIYLCIKEAVDGVQGQEFRHYGKPLRYELMKNTLMAYRQNHSRFFAGIITKIKASKMIISNSKNAE